jgi:hypothetical protein
MLVLDYCLERKITKVPLFEKKNAGVPVY